MRTDFALVLTAALLLDTFWVRILIFLLKLLIQHISSNKVMQPEGSRGVCWYSNAGLAVIPLQVGTLIGSLMNFNV